MSDRTETIKPVRIDLGDGDSLNLYRMSDYVTVVRFHGNNPNVQLSSAQVSTTALRAALDEVAPAGSYTRNAPDPDDMDGGVAAALIEKEVDRADALARLEALGDDGTALRCAVMIASVGAGEKTVAEFCKQVARGDDVNVAARAEKAEQERDEAREAWKGAVEAVKEANALINHLRAAESRPLTPDAITDEFVDYVHEDYFWSTSDRVRLEKSALKHALLDAVKRLAEASARPEGAEEIERLIETSPWHLAGSCSAEADWMAERGVRVVGEERP